jgi:hypothetical protein
LIHNKLLGRYTKIWIFHENCFSELLFKVGAWLSNHAVCKKGLRGAICRYSLLRLRQVVGRQAAGRINNLSNQEQATTDHIFSFLLLLKFFNSINKALNIRLQGLGREKEFKNLDKSEQFVLFY